MASRLPSDSTYAPDTRFEVAVSVVGGRHVATLSEASADGASSQRTLEDPSCVELLKSVAFVIAVAVEREREEHERTRAADPASAADAPATAKPAASARPARTPAPARDERRVTPSPAARPGSSAHLALLAGVRGTAAPTPELVPAARVGASLSFPRLGPMPSVHLSLLRTLSQSVSVDALDPERGATFTWTAGALEGCAGTPSRPDATVALAGCAGAEIGVLSAKGDGVVPPRTRHRFWLSAVALGRLRFPAETPLGLELDAGASIPLTRDEFVLAGPKTPVFKPPGVALSLGLGLTLRVW